MTDQQKFQPQTAIEQSLIYHLADADWRLRCAGTYESAVLLQRVELIRRNTGEDDNDLPEDPVFDEICLLGRALIQDSRGSDPLSKISRHEARLTRRYFKALAQLREARKDRLTGGTPPAPPNHEKHKKVTKRSQSHFWDEDTYPIENKYASTADVENPRRAEASEESGVPSGI